jgi:hypothetical protein
MRIAERGTVKVFCDNPETGKRYRITSKIESVDEYRDLTRPKFNCVAHEGWGMASAHIANGD